MAETSAPGIDDVALCDRASRGRNILGIKPWQKPTDNLEVLASVERNLKNNVAQSFKLLFRPLA
eukprot:6000364-Amphidinium_carterae.1